MKYIDGFVVPVPKKKLADYKNMPFDGKRMFMGGFEVLVKL